jgi:hypothetical protein
MRTGGGNQTLQRRVGRNPALFQSFFQHEEVSITSSE